MTTVDEAVKRLELRYDAGFWEQSDRDNIRTVLDALDWMATVERELDEARAEVARLHAVMGRGFEATLSDRDEAYVELDALQARVDEALAYSEDGAELTRGREGAAGVYMTHREYHRILSAPIEGSE